MYADTLLRLSKDTRHHGLPPPGQPRAFKRNPACGDEITLGFLLSGGLLAEPCFQARACAVCNASAAALCLCVDQLPPAEAAARARDVLAYLAGGSDWSAPWGADLLPALGAIRDRPMRLACARLPWETLLDALDAAEPA